MSCRSSDNWARLVTAVVKKDQILQLFHSQSRTPSICSEASSDLSYSSLSSSPTHDLSTDISSSSSSYSNQTFVRILGNSKLLLASDFNPPLHVEDVSIESTELLGRGTFGSVYLVVMENGARIVVKTSKSGIVSESEFKRKMEIVGNVWNDHVVSLKGYYSSQEKRCILYDYYSKGSVHDLLHGRFGEDQVPWETRIRIVIGAARGLAEIHSQYGVKLVHGNIKSSNILLNSEMYGCISDLGSANMIPLLPLQTAFCYAPEVKATLKVSQASDVYSFGILILELLTRKSPLQVDLVKLVTCVKNKEWAAEVFDADLLKHPSLKERVIKLFRIGMSCVIKSPKRRPKIFTVLDMLEDIGSMSIEGLAVRRKLGYVGYGNPIFASGLMLLARKEIILKNGNEILKDVEDFNASYRKCQQLIGNFGGMRHEENAFESLKSNNSDSQTCLVRHNYNPVSVSELLHGCGGGSENPLDWESRLKIAVGAARGIARIHRQGGGTLVHGNINASNIFMDEQKYCFVSLPNGGELAAKRSVPVALGTPTPEYYAIEHNDDGKGVSQASDVYRFGVVLHELFSGQVNMYRGGVAKLLKWVRSVNGRILGVEQRKWIDDYEAAMQLLILATDCVAYEPEHRPKMAQVVRVLERISARYFEDQQGSRLEEDDKVPIESRLEHILDDLLPKLPP